MKRLERIRLRGQFSTAAAAAKRAATLARIKQVNIQNRLRLLALSAEVIRHSPKASGVRPVAFFNASARLGGLSQNAAFAYLAACAVQLAGTPAAYFICQAGMSRCVLGTQADHPTRAMPCGSCTGLSHFVYSNGLALPFHYEFDPAQAAQLKGLNCEQLAQVELNLPGLKQPFPAGELVLPALRWALRRHDLVEDDPTHLLFREYILSAWRTAVEFERFVQHTEPQQVVVFNGIMFPEASARWVAQQHSLRVTTHEVGLQPLTGYFTPGDATAYPIDIPESFELSPEQNTRLDAYLEQRFQGHFSMAGIRFWPEMQQLDADFLQKAAEFKQLVPIFTNVIFDTSQKHANRVFPHMFAWLDTVLETVRAHPETLFVLRAHPDEMRPGKQSRQSVAEWAQQSGALSLPNLVFFHSQQYVSSYELIRRAKFVIVYNSSIGLEAALMGAAVLNGGKARYTQLPIVYFPPTVEEYQRQAEEFLAAEQVVADPQFQRNARRFLYYQLYRTSLPFDEFLTKHPNPSLVQLRAFPWQKLAPGGSASMDTIVKGILAGGDFLLPESRNGSR